MSTNSVARWIKSVLSNAGIDTPVFKAHNIRCASVTNANKGGVPVAEILRTVDRTNERTFRNYYLESRLFSFYATQDPLLEDLSAIKYVNFCSTVGLHWLRFFKIA